MLGSLWFVLTLAFEAGLGRLVMGYWWERIISDYKILEGKISEVDELYARPQALDVIRQSLEAYRNKSSWRKG